MIALYIITLCNTLMLLYIVYMLHSRRDSVISPRRTLLSRPTAPATPAQVYSPTKLQKALDIERDIVG